MSVETFKSALWELCQENSSARDDVKAGKKKLDKEFGLTCKENFVLFLCGVYSGHIDLHGASIDEDPDDKQKKFRDVLRKLSDPNTPEFRTQVKQGNENLRHKDGEGRSLTYPQIEVLYEVGICCGNLK